MLEIWKDAVGFPGYSVSSIGRVRSNARTATRINPSGRRVEQPISTKLLKAAFNSKTRYGHVVLRQSGKSVSVYLHVLVAQAFVPGYSPELEVCHCDGNRTNNSAENLRWDTRKGNAADTLLHGTHLRGETQNGARLTEEAVLEIRRQRAAGMAWAAIAKHHDIAIMTAHAAGTGRSWKHLPQNQSDRPVPAIHAD